MLYAYIPITGSSNLPNEKSLKLFDLKKGLCLEPNFLQNSENLYQTQKCSFTLSVKERLAYGHRQEGVGGVLPYNITKLSFS